MLLGFRVEFEPYVKDGSKPHTIRARRKIRPRVGETCHCYVGLRTKGARLLGRWECVKVEEIRIRWTGRAGNTPRVAVAGKRLNVRECNALAWRDGFRSRGREFAFAEMMKFFAGRLPFVGDLIHWRYTREVAAR